MNDSNSNDTGYSVYLLYQKEVYSSDHSFLQSMMDWLYTSADSPLKFYFRNKAFVNISHNGILIRKENTTSSNQTDQSNWNQIYFNFKHLKEIYVDKRHKDTCVLVSKVSSSTSSNYVWKKTNPSNYQSFRTAYSMNSAYKKSFLLTILKFKDGPSRLLQTIQLLDSVLVDYNKKEDLINKSLKSNPELSNIIYNTLSHKTADVKNYKKSDLSQLYSNFVKSNSRNSIESITKAQKNSSNLSLNQQIETPISNRLRNRSQQIIGKKSSRNHSVDNRVSNKSIYNSNSNSNTSLQSFQSNNFNYRSGNSNNLSRQSSINDLTHQNAPLIMNRGYLPNNLIDLKYQTMSPSSLNNYTSKQTSNRSSLILDKKIIIKPHSSTNLTYSNNLTNEKSKKEDPDFGKNIKIKLVNDPVNFENNISESSENEDLESSNQIETVIERKIEPEDDVTRNEFEETNTNTIHEDLSANNNTETINDSNLDTINNYDFNLNAKSLAKLETIQKVSQNIYYNLFKDEYNNINMQTMQPQMPSQIRPMLNQNKITNLVRNASLSSSNGINDDKNHENKESNLKVRDIINSFNNLNNLSKKPEFLTPIQNQIKNFLPSKITNIQLGNRLPPPVKLIQNDFTFKKSNIILNKSPTQFGTGSPKLNSDSPSLSINTFETLNSANSFYHSNYFSRPGKVESPCKLNNDITLINNKLARIVNLLTSSSSDQLNEQFKKLDELTEAGFMSTSDDFMNQAKIASHTPVATMAPRKRTFANMVWPMDPEEEKILRSTSPFIVPEIIVQKPERVKSILKKSNCFLSTSASGFDLTSCSNQPMTQSTAVMSTYSNATDVIQSASNNGANANKKRVDFHENFCYINFFDTHEEN